MLSLQENIRTEDELQSKPQPSTTRRASLLDMAVRNFEEEIVETSPRRHSMYSTTSHLDARTIAGVHRRSTMSHTEAVQLVEDKTQWNQLRKSIRESGAVTGISLRQHLPNLIQRAIECENAQYLKSLV